MSTKAHAGLEAKLFYQGDDSAIREAIGDRTFIRAKVHADCAPGRLLAAAAAERDDVGRVMAAGPEALEALKLYVLDLDELAELFRREVGMMAPFKDEPPVPSGHSHDERQAAWTAWWTGFQVRRAEAARAAFEKAGVQP